MDEPTLISDACNGDLDAFNHLVLTYQNLAYNLAYNLLGEEDSAQDATQTGFIAAYRNLTSYRGGSFKAWILRIVTNACYDELRRRQRHPTIPLEIKTEDDEDIEEPRWLADDDPSPEETAETNEMVNAIQHCLGDLPEDFRAVAVLVDVDGLDYDEASLILNKPLGTIKSRLARARSRLRNCLQGYWELLPEKFRLDYESKK
jgi:RNA polymerase sigma-70 factor, ECF subfamily